MLATGSKSLNTYRLSIRVFADGFSFSVVNLFDGKEMRAWQTAFSDEREAAQVLNEALNQPTTNDYEYADTELIFVSPTTIVPLDSFHREAISTIYRFNYPSNTGKSVVEYEVIPSLDAVVLYTHMKAVREAMQALYPHTEVHSIDAKHLLWAYEQHRLEDHDAGGFYVFDLDGRLTICAFQHNRLHFTCTYQAENADDRIYHILTVWKQLQWNEKKDVCRLAVKDEELQKQLKRFIKNVEICA